MKIHSIPQMSTTGTVAIASTDFGISRIPGMEATNKHELAIAKVVDQICAEGRLDLTVIPEVTAALDFMMSRSDSEFLVRYIKWRLASPIAK